MEPKDDLDPRRLRNALEIGAGGLGGVTVDARLDARVLPREQVELVRRRLEGGAVDADAKAGLEDGVSDEYAFVVFPFPLRASNGATKRRQRTKVQ